jgi:hypothetical protein
VFPGWHGNVHLRGVLYLLSDTCWGKGFTGFSEIEEIFHPSTLLNVHKILFDRKEIPFGPGLCGISKKSTEIFPSDLYATCILLLHYRSLLHLDIIFGAFDLTKTLLQNIQEGSAFLFSNFYVLLF